MPPKKSGKGKAKSPKTARPNPIAGPFLAKKNSKVDQLASFLDSDSDDFTDDARSVAMSDVRSDHIDHSDPVEVPMPDD